MQFKVFMNLVNFSCLSFEPKCRNTPKRKKYTRRQNVLIPQFVYYCCVSISITIQDVTVEIPHQNRFFFSLVNFLKRGINQSSVNSVTGTLGCLQIQPITLLKLLLLKSSIKADSISLDLFIISSFLNLQFNSLSP